MVDDGLNDSLDSLGSNLEKLLGKVLVVHGQTNGRNEGEPLISLFVVDHLSRVS